MGFFKNIKEGIKAQKKLVDAINNGDVVVDRKSMTIERVEKNEDQKDNQTNNKNK